ncbi:MAG: hypothetical protein ACPHQO_03290, partial [Candidatus Kariarchaeum pelagius]
GAIRFSKEQKQQDINSLNSIWNSDGSAGQTIPGYEKIDVEEKYIMSKRQNVNQPYYYKKSKAEVVLSGTFYLGFIYLISWIIVFGALRLILLEPWGLNG